MTTSALDFDACYAAASGRDARFDGQFVTAVLTTGIYCRPSCPARTPRRESCTFFETSAAAHLAGFRACRRCLPEAVPGSPAWDLREDVAARAMRLIAEGIVDREGVPGLAARLGFSTRQLTRTLTERLGAGPLALARAQRAQTARQLLVSTAMPISDVAFAAGFSSIRQFNDTIAEVFGLTPTAVRAAARRGERPATSAPPGSITLTLRAREPFDGASVHRWMAVRAIAGLEDAAGGAYARSFRLSRGAATAAIDHHADRVALTARLEHLDDLPELLARVRRLYDVDADPVAIDRALATDPALAAAVAAAPGMRVPGTADGFEMLVRAILGQQVTVAAGRTAVQRLVDALGEDLPRDLVAGELSRLFPSAAAVAEHAEAVVRGPAGRTRALLEASRRVADGTLELTPARPFADLTRELEAIPGIGPWTSHYLALRVLKSPDILLTGDVAVRAGARALGLPADPKGLAAYAALHAPWRSYLMVHLWRAAEPAPTSKEP